MARTVECLSAVQHLVAHNAQNVSAQQRLMFCLRNVLLLQDANDSLWLTYLYTVIYVLRLWASVPFAGAFDSEAAIGIIMLYGMWHLGFITRNFISSSAAWNPCSCNYLPIS